MGDPATALKTNGWLLTYERNSLADDQMRYNFLAVLARSAIDRTSLPSCQRTTKVVHLLDCNIFWAAFPPQRAGKMLALQGLMEGGSVTQQDAAGVFAAAATDPDSAPLGSLQALLRPLVARSFFQSAEKRQRV